MLAEAGPIVRGGHYVLLMPTTGLPVRPAAISGTLTAPTPRDPRALFDVIRRTNRFTVTDENHLGRDEG
jgi:hypothetical protein